MIVDSAFPTGNGIVERLQGDEVDLRPDVRDTEGGWFYWHVRIRDAAGRTVRVRLTQPNCLTVRGAAVSVDRGATWSWLPASARDGDQLSVAVPAGCDDLRLSMGMPYGMERLERFLSARAGDARLRRSELCRSRRGRSVPLLRVGASEAPVRVVVTARHHCCEMMASYSVEGLLEAALGDDALGRWFSERATIVCVPFVDHDGVEDGDQGKNRRPHDHGRDYAGERAEDSIYPECAAVRRLVEGEAGGRVDIALDLHGPWIHGPWNEWIYQVGSALPPTWQGQCALAPALEAACASGPLPYRAADDLPFGSAWNTAVNYVPGCRSPTRWFAERPTTRFASTLEIPYADVRGVAVDQASARGFGRCLAQALRDLLS